MLAFDYLPRDREVGITHPADLCRGVVHEGQRTNSFTMLEEGKELSTVPIPKNLELLLYTTQFCHCSDPFVLTEIVSLARRPIEFYSLSFARPCSYKEGVNVLCHYDKTAHHSSSGTHCTVRLCHMVAVRGRARSSSHKEEHRTSMCRVWY